MGKAKVRSLIGDYSYGHFEVVHCEWLSENSEGREWVSSFRPDSGYGLKNYMKSRKYPWISGKQNVWCGEVWYGIKKHWTLQAQRVARSVMKELSLEGGRTAKRNEGVTSVKD